MRFLRDNHPVPYSKTAWFFALLMLIGAACNRTPQGVLLWPGNSVITSSSQFHVEADEQLAALRKADPKRDADRAFFKGDYRFIADRPALARIQGVPDDLLVNTARQRSGFVVVAFSDELFRNDEFLKLKRDYEKKYNQELYRLIREADQKR